MRRLGIDPGSRRIGLAVSDEGGVLASPHKTVLRTSRQQAVTALVDEIRALGVGEVVMGLPLNMDGSRGGAARRAQELAADLERAGGVPVVMWDERLSTVAAERALAEAGLRGQRRRRVVDQAAAVVLLQSYLDSKSESLCRGDDQVPPEVDGNAGGRGRGHGNRSGC